MFLFSGAFFPIQQLPVTLQWLVHATPLFHSVEMLRQLTTGAINVSLFVHIGYLVVAGFTALAIAMSRLERALIR
jgi:lipooligosaccharide transport system permease protein